MVLVYYIYGRVHHLLMDFGCIEESLAVVTHLA